MVLRVNVLFCCSYVMTNIGSKRRTAPHSGRNNAAKRAAAAAKKKRANNYATFLSAMTFVTPYRKKLERNQAFNNTVANIRRGVPNVSYAHQNRMRPLGLTQQQWFALAGVLNIIQRHPNVNVINALAPIGARVRATGRYTNANRNTLIAWARSR
jgi:hypothetical protein